MAMHYKCDHCEWWTTDPNKHHKSCEKCLSGMLFATGISVIEELTGGKSLWYRCKCGAEYPSYEEYAANHICPLLNKNNPVGSTFDPARHPSHYHEGKGIDPIGVMRETFSASELEGFFKGSALKYIMRYQSKNGKQDLEKAKYYVEQLISLYTGEVPNGNETK